MQKPNVSIEMPVGNISSSNTLGKYYQDFTQAIHHFDKEYFGSFDESGIPMQGFGSDAYYNQVYIIQYGLILHDLILDGKNVKSNTIKLTNCINWLIENKEETADYIVWRNDFDLERWGLKKGWISGMYQGQAISLLLRYGQLINQEEQFTSIALKVFNFFSIDYKNGGVRRYDNKANLWFEEYPSEQPSFVLNGFIYCFFGIYDLYRITQDKEIKQTVDLCIKTLEESIELYDCGYWSVYDQLKRELATKYYHKNIHIPLLEILYKLFGISKFEEHSLNWQKQLNSKTNLLRVELMYRVRPRIRKLLNK